jgi:hypothetical protein
LFEQQQNDWEITVAMTVLDLNGQHLTKHNSCTLLQSIGDAGLTAIAVSQNVDKSTISRFTHDEGKLSFTAQGFAEFLSMLDLKIVDHNQETFDADEVEAYRKLAFKYMKMTTPKSESKG